MTDRPKILFVVGPTASGKSDLAIRIAKEYNGEIICADSQTVRRGLNIGTAKPSSEDQSEVPHHLLDVIDPYERFSAADFKHRAEAVIAKLLAKGKLPVVVGGTGLYIDSLLYDFSFRGDVDPVVREELEKKTSEELQEMIKGQGLELPTNLRNPRHLVRTLESAGLVGSNKRHREDALVIGIDPGKEELERRIELRVGAMLKGGFLDEVELVLRDYGFLPKDFDAIGYKIALANRNDVGDYDTEKIAQAFIIADRQYAKRQRTWFKRNPNIHWFTTGEEAYEYVIKLL